MDNLKLRQPCFLIEALRKILNIYLLSFWKWGWIGYGHHILEVLALPALGFWPCRSCVCVRERSSVWVRLRSLACPCPRFPLAQASFPVYMGQGKIRLCQRGWTGARVNPGLRGLRGRSLVGQSQVVALLNTHDVCQDTLKACHRPYPDACTQPETLHRSRVLH